MTFTDFSLLYRMNGKPKKCTFIFCADHGVAEEGVSAYPQSTTAEMIKNYLVYQGAAANVFANFAGSELFVVDVGVNADISDLPGLIDRKIAYGTKNFTKGSAMTKGQAHQAIKIGRELARKALQSDYNIFLLGEMGISNTTSAAAMTSAFFEVSSAKTVGRGSNISDERLKRKKQVIRQALKVNQPDSNDPYDILAKVGGFEFGAMVGLILEVTRRRHLVILDGFNTAVAALLAYEIQPSCVDYLIAPHLSREPGHLPVLNHLDLAPIFKFDFALSEAVGSSVFAKIMDNLTYVYTCDPTADFDGDLSDFKDDDEEEEFINHFVENFGLDLPAEIDNIEDLQEFLGDDIQVGEIPLDFQLSDQRLEKFIPPFSTQEGNIPRRYPMMARVMDSDDNEAIAATDKTFNFYLETMPRINYKAMESCHQYIDTLSKPKRALGILEEIAVQVAGITKEEKPTNYLRRAALAFVNIENCPGITGQEKIKPQLLRLKPQRDIPLDFSSTVRTFAMKIFLGVVAPDANPTVAFNFGRTLAEEISFNIPIIALTDLSDVSRDKVDIKFSNALLTKNMELKVPPEEFLNYVPKKYRNMASAIIGAIIAAVHNSTLVVVDSGAVEIITRYLEKICPDVRPFILHATKLIIYDFPPGKPIGFDGEVACMGVEIVEAALTMLNEMKTFQDTDVSVSLDGKIKIKKH